MQVQTGQPVSFTSKVNFNHDAVVKVLRQHEGSDEFITQFNKVVDHFRNDGLNDNITIDVKPSIALKHVPDHARSIPKVTTKFDVTIESEGKANKGLKIFFSNFNVKENIESLIDFINGLKKKIS
jgi:hypothetical protein